MVTVDQVWSAVPLFILFREAIEASIIVSVLISFVRRVNAPHLERQIWWGVSMAVILSIILGIIFVVVFYVASQNLFQGKNQMIFKGVVSWVACIMITILSFAMLRFMGWEEKWTRRMQEMGQKVNQRKKEQGEQDDVEGKLPEGGMEAGKSISAGGLTLSSSGGATSAGGATRTSGSDDMLSAGGFEGKVVPHGSSDASSDGEEHKVKVPCYRWRWPEWKEWLFGSHEFSEVEMEERWTKRYAFFLAVFLTVLREGLESAVFLAGVGNSVPTAIILPGIIGIACGVCVGVILYYSGKQVKNIGWLFITMSIVLFFIAAGQCEMGASWLMKAGMFGPWYPGPMTVPVPEGAAPQQEFGDGDEVYDAGGGEDDGYMAIDQRAWYLRPLWNICGCCSDQDSENKFLSLARAIFGYNCQPTFIDVVFYCGFWILVICFACWKLWQGTLFDADFKYNKMRRKEAEEAERLALKGLPETSSDSHLPSSIPTNSLRKRIPEGGSIVPGSPDAMLAPSPAPPLPPQKWAAT